MSGTERRKYPRHELEAGVTLCAVNMKIPSAMIHISTGGVGLITDGEILPGEKLNITLNHVGQMVRIFADPFTFMCGWSPAR